jgi:hypothetical protein
MSAIAFPKHRKRKPVERHLSENEEVDPFGLDSTLGEDACGESYARQRYDIPSKFSFPSITSIPLGMYSSD